MSSNEDKEKEKTEDDFKEMKEIFSEMEKYELLNMIKDCWEAKNNEIQSLIRNTVAKKRRQDDKIQEQKDQDKKDIFETNWVFPETFTGCPQSLDIKEKVIKLGLYRQKTKDLQPSDIEWDNTKGVLVARIERNGCKEDCGGDEVLTVAVERNEDRTKKRVKVLSVGECYCTNCHGNYLRYEFHAKGPDFGYPEGAIEENTFDVFP